MTAATLLRELDQRMTPAPWVAMTREDSAWFQSKDGKGIWLTDNGSDIAIARNALPALADALEAAEKYLADLDNEGEANSNALRAALAVVAAQLQGEQK